MFGKLEPTPPPPGLPPSGFWSSVNFSASPTGCWIWCGALTTFGHGVAAYRGRPIGAHRVAYDLVRGAVALGLVLRHTCDNAPCVNPDHLVPGTADENRADMVARGRATWQRQRLLTLADCVIYGVVTMWARARGIDPYQAYRWLTGADPMPAAVHAIFQLDVAP